MRNPAFKLVVAICHARLDVRRAHRGTKTMEGLHAEIQDALKPEERRSWEKTNLPTEVLALEIDEIENRIMDGYQ